MEDLKLKVDNLKDLLFDPSFQPLFTKWLVKNKLDIISKTGKKRARYLSQFDDITKRPRYEIKGTVIRNKGKNYRTSKPTFNLEDIENLLNKDSYFIDKHRKMSTYRNCEKVNFVSSWSQFNLTKFDVFIGVIYFSDLIKIVRFTKEDLISLNKLSRQHSSRILTFALDKNNIKDIIKKGSVKTIKYKDLFN